MGTMALPMVLIGTTIGVGVRAPGAAGVSDRAPAAPRPVLGKVMDMGSGRGRGRDRDMATEVGVVVLVVVDMDPEVATVILVEAVPVADTVVQVVADMVVQVATSIVRQPLRKTAEANMGRKIYRL